MPTTMPVLFWPGHCTLLLGPPSVPRGIIAPSRQSTAWRVVSPLVLENPAIVPRLSMLFGTLSDPPSVCAASMTLMS